MINNMIKTAMQQLIDEIVEHLTYDDDLSDDSRTTLETIRLRCLGKLAIEKEQMDKVSEDWFVEGCSHMNDNKRIYESFEQYYGKTYGQ
jgi:hypothetical protein